MRRNIARAVLLVLSLLWLVVIGLSITACGKKEEPQAEGYYEGPMLPKGQRTGTGPAQGATN
ncbi:hypothetical protein HRbin16_02168 [bacterium HR16]|nr:hypothetical protein HRbin16_02168 [bacterium HR16]